MVCIFISLDDPFLIQDGRIFCFFRIQNDLTNQILQFKENVYCCTFTLCFEVRKINSISIFLLNVPVF